MALQVSFCSRKVQFTPESLTTALNPDNELTGSWDSLHVFEAHERGRSAKYKLTSTVILVLNTNKDQAGRKEGDVGDVSLSGSMTRQVGSVPSLAR